MQGSRRLAAVFRTGLSLLAFSAASMVLVGCPKTQFFDEGRGQPGDRALGQAPPGSVGACKVFGSLRPPIVNEELWNDLRPCNRRTPRRYLRIGFSGISELKNEDEERRLKYVMEALTEADEAEDGNTKMRGMLRAVQRMALEDEKLKARVERTTGRTFPCDYTHLLHTTEKQYTRISTQPDECPAYAYDPKKREDVCLFDTRIEEARWLTSAWGCLAFTETLGEGNSCYKLCAYDDYCTSQVSCSQPDFDLVLCTLGVCMPEKVVAIY
ncbi:MAG: hypothetical protein R3B72_13740 [Polyangiaceae bacterium]